MDGVEGLVELRDELRLRSGVGGSLVGLLLNGVAYLEKGTFKFLLAETTFFFLLAADVAAENGVTLVFAWQLQSLFLVPSCSQFVLLFSHESGVELVCDSDAVCSCFYFLDGCV